MSEQSWIEEFYPLSATEAANLAETEDDDLIAVDHSLQKWKGLRDESLSKHGLDKPPVTVFADTCSLCVRFMDEDAEEDDKCSSCPLYQARSGFACDDRRPNEGISPYWEYRRMNIQSRTPEIMISWLGQTRNFVLNSQT